jgi:hypothetical protein
MRNCRYPRESILQKYSNYPVALFVFHRCTYKFGIGILFITEIGKGDWPLVRIARWPREAQCALAVTGDVDALTIWDYGQRMWNAS